MIAVSSCSLFLKKETILIGDFTEKYYELPEDPEVVNYIIDGPQGLYQYIKVNESTNACEKKSSPELKKNCYKKILERENVKK